ILYAVLYALGGASHVPGTNIQKKGTNVGLSVVMVFSVNGEDYKVERKKAGAYLYDGDGVMLASGTSNVTKKIEDLLGMSIKRFRQLKYAEQKKAHALLSIGATELHKIIEELTGIDQINVALDKVKAIIALSGGAMEVLAFEGTEELESFIEEQETSHAHWEGEVNDLVAARLEKNKIIDSLFQKKERLNATRIDYNHWKVEHSTLASNQEIFKSDVDRLTDSADDIVFSEFVEDIKNKESKIGVLDNALSDAKAKALEAKQLKSEYEILEDFIHKGNRMIQRSQKDYDEMSESLSEGEIAAAEKLLEEQREIAATAQLEFSNISALFKESKCPTCKRDYEGSTPVTEQQVSACESICDEENGKLRKMKRSLKDLTMNWAVKQELENDIRRNTLSVSDAVIDSANKKAEGERLDCLSPVEIEEEESLVKKLRSDLNGEKFYLAKQKDVHSDRTKALGKLKICEKSLESLIEPEFDQDKMDDVDLQYSGTLEDRENLNESLVAAEKEVSTQSATLASSKEKLTKLKEDNEVYDKVLKRNNTAKALLKYLRDNRDRYTGDIWDYFLGSASTFVSDCTNGVITQILRTEGGQFQFVEEEEAMGMQDASGAQEAIMGISVQLALAQAAQCPLDILLVDEPTADMDDEHSMAVAGMLSMQGKQVIAISHREMDSSMCNNVINLGE
ncbi:MAG: hypothetical protein DRI46_12105, partial [Chloroflexi bacterium]